MSNASNVYPHQYKHFISTSPAAIAGIDFDNPVITGTPVELSALVKMGRGITQLDENPNAVTNETAYIDSVSSATTTDSYTPQFSGSLEMMTNQDAINSIIEVPTYQRTGGDAERILLVAHSFEAGATAGTIKARLFRVAVEVSSITRSGVEKVTGDFNLNSVKDPIFGELDPDSMEFTIVAKPAAGA